MRNFLCYNDNTMRMITEVPLKNRFKKTALRALALLLILLSLPVCAFSALATESPFAGEALEYYDALLEKGFPRDYA